MRAITIATIIGLAATLLSVPGQAGDLNTDENGDNIKVGDKVVAVRGENLIPACPRTDSLALFYSEEVNGDFRQDPSQLVSPPDLDKISDFLSGHQCTMLAPREAGVVQGVQTVDAKDKFGSDIIHMTCITNERVAALGCAWVSSGMLDKVLHINGQDYVPLAR